MSYPKLNGFGIVENPILETPFVQNNDSGSSFSANLFLLMDGQHFLLMNGEQFLLMG